MGIDDPSGAEIKQFILDNLAGEEETKMLTYNSSKDVYEGYTSGNHISVNSDVYAEERQRMVKEHVEEGMSEEEAYNKAEETLSDPTVWQGDMEGVIISKIED